MPKSVYGVIHSFSFNDVEECIVIESDISPIQMQRILVYMAYRFEELVCRSIKGWSFDINRLHLLDILAEVYGVEDIKARFEKTTLESIFDSSEDFVPVEYCYPVALSDKLEREIGISQVYCVDLFDLWEMFGGEQWKENLLPFLQGKADEVDKLILNYENYDYPTIKSHLKDICELSMDQDVIPVMYEYQYLDGRESWKEQMLIPYTDVYSVYLLTKSNTLEACRPKKDTEWITTSEIVIWQLGKDSSDITEVDLSVIALIDEYKTELELQFISGVQKEMSFQKTKQAYNYKLLDVASERESDCYELTISNESPLLNCVFGNLNVPKECLNNSLCLFTYEEIQQGLKRVSLIANGDSILIKYKF